MNQDKEHLAAVRSIKAEIFRCRHKLEILKLDTAAVKARMKDLESDLFEMIDEGPGLFAGDGDFAPVESDGTQTTDTTASEEWREILLADEFPLKPRMIKALTEHSPAIESVGQLVDWMNSKGDWWAKDIKGIGEEAAEEIANAMEQFWADNPELTGEQADADSDDTDCAESATLLARMIVSVPVVPGEDLQEDQYDLKAAKFTAELDGDSVEYPSDVIELENTIIWRDFTAAIQETKQQQE